ncbi:lysylphosphatidylglycerol synthetase family protein [Halobacteriales archaeon QS_8_69_26]|nr:MAG: lysylphosphatidylglycerol synthetase family protein [Halobacteriales archaeon QS_8_69_26]
MRDGDVRALVVGFATAAAILAVLFWVVGIDEVAAALSRAELDLVALAALLMVAWMVAWGITLKIVLTVIGVEAGVLKAVLIYAAAGFANNVTPLGQAGGEPITALLIADVTDAEYETGLAAIASVDALNFIPSMTLALVGVAYYAINFDFGRRLEVLAAGVVGLAVVAVLLAALAWRYRYTLEERVVRALGPVLRAVGRVVPRVTPPDPDDLADRVEGFFGAVERVATDRRSFLAALTFSTLGWLSQALALWVAILALGVSIPVYVPLFVIPLGTTASVVPTPGGLGGIETVHILLLTLATGVTAPVATGAVTIHRIGGFFFVTGLGAGAAAFVRTWRR